ncbi:hypothetical protein HQ520_12950 [bacterium]|nr:hypothetical protein [bacterium]
MRPIIFIVAVVMMTCLGSASLAASSDPAAPENQANHVVKVLRTSNKAQINRYVPKVYEFTNVNPGRFAVRKFGDFIGAEEGVIDTYMAPDGKSGLVLVVVPEYQLPLIDQVMAETDRADLSSSSGSKFAYVPVKNRSVFDPDFVANLFLYGGSDNEILSDDETNSLLIHGAPGGIKAILSGLELYDIPTPQVSLSARLYEVDVKNDGALGLDFHAWKNGPGQALFSGGSYYEFARIDNGSPTQFDSGAGTPGLPQQSMNSHGYHTAIYADVPSAFFDYLAIQGKAEVLTDSSVTVLNNQHASFSSTEEIPYFYSDPGAVTADILPEAPGQDLLGAPVNARRVRNAIAEVGIEMEVVPTIALEDISIEIYTRVSDLMGFDGTGVPQVNLRETETTIRARDGEEIVLGGLNRERTVKSSNKVPILGSIPVLGYLFGRESTSRHVTTVVQVVSPHIIRDDGLTVAQRETISRVQP